MSNLAEAIVELRRADVLREVERRVKEGDKPINIINDCKDGMLQVGARFSAGEFFLAELILAGEIFTEGFELVAPYMKAQGGGEESRRSTVVIATPKGDIHDLGKNIVLMMLRAHGFEVHDLGVDVEPRRIVEKVAELKPQFVGLSTLLTTGLFSCQQVVDALAAEGLRGTCKVIIGGGVTTAMARDYIGADFQTTDVMEGVEYCMRIDAQLAAEAGS